MTFYFLSLFIHKLEIFKLKDFTPYEKLYTAPMYNSSSFFYMHLMYVHTFIKTIEKEESVTIIWPGGSRRGQIR